MSTPNVTLIRCRRETVASLRRWAARASASRERAGAVPWWAGDEPTDAEAIAELVRRAHAHLERGGKCKTARALRRARGQT